MVYRWHVYFILHLTFQFEKCMLIFISVENLEHNDFIALRNMLIR